MTRLILASGSPRRIEMMSRITEDFKVISPDVDETAIEGESPGEMVERLALLKAATVFKATGGELPVLAADTIVVLDGVLGKPADEEDAVGMLRRLSGNKHQVMTGVAIIKPGYDEPGSLIETTDVFFDSISDEDIKGYVAGGEPMDKAGAYGIQGEGGRFIRKVDGCFYNVMGFPLNSIYTKLREMKII